MQSGFRCMSIAIAIYIYTLKCQLYLMVSRPSTFPDPGLPARVHNKRRELLLPVAPNKGVSVAP